MYLYSIIKMILGPINLRSQCSFDWGSWSLHPDTTPLQPNHTVTSNQSNTTRNHTVTPTHIEPEQYNTWNISTISRKLLKMNVLTVETCWAVNSEIIKQVTSSWSFFIQVSLTLFKSWHWSCPIMHRTLIYLCSRKHLYVYDGHESGTNRKKRRGLTTCWFVQNLD